MRKPLEIFSMITIEKRTAEQPATAAEQNAYAQFLFQNLEAYGDAKPDIQKALDYALGKNQKPGGCIYIARDENQKIVGVTVLLHTLMDGFIPENILVYIATDAQKRGQGIGRQLMQHAITHTQGAIALHVEPHNPAQHLYEKLGFENKYLEMRLTR